MVLRQATLVTTTSYTTEGLVQMMGSGSIVDDALVYTYWLRCVREILHEESQQPKKLPPLPPPPTDRLIAPQHGIL